MSLTFQRDVTSLISPKIASAFTAVTAGGGGDNTAVTGITIDRFAKGSVPLNGTLSILWQATLAASQTLTIKAVEVEHSDNGSSWGSYKTFADPGVVATGVGTAVKGAVEIGVDLGSAKRFVRAKFTPDLSAANTDTANLVAAFVLAGFDRLPV